MTEVGQPPFGVILAGGEGRRIGGDKAFVQLGGVPLLTHVGRRLEPQCLGLAINANDDPNRYAAFGYDVLGDGAHQGRGPLAGVLAAMTWAKMRGATRVLTAPVDTPFLPNDFARRLGAVDAPIVLAETKDGLHGTCGLWDVSLHVDLRAALDGGLRKVTEWTWQNGAKSALFGGADQPPFFNINRPEELQRAEAMLPQS